MTRKHFKSKELRREAALAVSLLTALIACAGDALAQAAAPPEVEISPAISARMQWISFAMVSGRVTASSGLAVPQMQVNVPGRRSRRRESLSIEINDGRCALQYDSAGPDESLRITLSGGDRLSIRRARAADRYVLEFQQRPAEPLSLVIDEQDAKRTLRAAGFWQLYLAEPDVVRAHLVPLLELLRPSWQLTAMGAEIEHALVHTAHAASVGEPDRKAWARHIADLGSSRFSQRQNAQRELLRAGPAVVPYLQNLDRAGLDAEQGARIRAIIETLAVDYEDRPQRVAAWLAGDARAWLALLTREDASRRRVAAEQLGKLLGAPVDFDPDGAPDVRKAQLEQLQAQVQNAKAARPVEE
jgi:hypothetical protein